MYGHSVVLVAVAEAGIRDLIETILGEIIGVQTALAQNEEEALRKAKQLQPAMVLLDLRPSEVSRLQLLKHLKSDPDTQSIPVIVFSTWGKDQEEARKAGCHDFIEEPFDLELLIAKLEQCLLTRVR